MLKLVMFIIHKLFKLKFDLGSLQKNVFYKSENSNEFCSLVIDMITTFFVPLPGCKAF